MPICGRPSSGSKFQAPELSERPQGSSAEANNLSWKPSQLGVSSLPAPCAPQPSLRLITALQLPHPTAPSNHLPWMIQQIFPPWGEKQG